MDRNLRNRAEAVASRLEGDASLIRELMAAAGETASPLPTGIARADRVRVLMLSKRSRNCLAGGGINTVGDLLGTTIRDLLCIRGLGIVALNEIVFRLGRWNLTLETH